MEQLMIAVSGPTGPQKTVLLRMICGVLCREEISHVLVAVPRERELELLVPPTADDVSALEDAQVQILESKRRPNEYPLTHFDIICLLQGIVPPEGSEIRSTLIERGAGKVTGLNHHWIWKRQFLNQAPDRLLWGWYQECRKACLEAGTGGLQDGTD